MTQNNQQDFDLLGAVQKAGRTVLDAGLVGLAVGGRAIADGAESALAALKSFDEEEAKSRTKADEPAAGTNARETAAKTAAAAAAKPAAPRKRAPKTAAPKAD